LRLVASNLIARECVNEREEGTGSFGCAQDEFRLATTADGIEPGSRRGGDKFRPPLRDGRGLKTLKWGLMDAGID
jgi:hypothetical protein